MARALPSLAESPAGIDTLVRIAVFAVDPAERDLARRVIRSVCVERGIVAASIQGLYEAVAQGRIAGFSVPICHLRGPVYDAARAAFRAAKALQVGAFQFAISRVEMEDGCTRPAEYSACILAAALREGWTGPVFLRSDLAIREAVDAAFFNLELDGSPFIAPEPPSAQERQRACAERAADTAKFVRSLQPPGLEISVCGRLRGNRCSVEEVEAFLEACLRRASGAAMSTLSVPWSATSTDFEILRDIGAVCRARGVAGAGPAVEATLPEEKYREFPRNDAVEVHLAAALQQIVAEHPKLPEALRKASAARAWGTLKRELWELPPAALHAIGEALESKFLRTFSLLGVKGTRKLIEAHVKPVPVLTPLSAGL